MVTIIDISCIFYLRKEDILEIFEEVYFDIDVRKKKIKVDVKFKNYISKEILRIYDCTAKELNELLMSGKLEVIKKRFRRMK
jgi:hypothetical protein